MVKEASENPRIQYELLNWKSSCCQVCESDDRAVRDEKVFQQAEKAQVFRHTEVPQVEEKEEENSPDYDDGDYRNRSKSPWKGPPGR